MIHAFSMFGLKLINPDPQFDIRRVWVVRVRSSERYPSRIVGLQPGMYGTQRHNEGPSWSYPFSMNWTKAILANSKPGSMMHDAIGPFLPVIGAEACRSAFEELNAAQEKMTAFFNANEYHQDYVDKYVGLIRLLKWTVKHGGVLTFQ